VVKNVYPVAGAQLAAQGARGADHPAVELVWSKQRILEVYLNVAEFDKACSGSRRPAALISACPASALTARHDPALPGAFLSPFCRKVRLVLAEKKIEVELIEERYWERRPISCAATRPARCRCCIDGTGDPGRKRRRSANTSKRRYPEPPLMPGWPAERATRCAGW
jgi:hypothetical protein